MSVSDVLIVVVGAASLASTVIFGGAPFTQDKIVKLYQIRFQSPGPGEIGTFTQPDGSSTEAVIYHVNRALYPGSQSVPFGSVVLVVSCCGSDAQCMWNGKLVTLPRRWIRRVTSEGG